MKTLTAIAAALMLIVGPAFGQTLIGEWQVVKSFCEDGKELRDWSREDNRTTFDKASVTKVIMLPKVDEKHKMKDCALHTKTNYSIDGNQYKKGPFLEISSPKCPAVAIEIRELMKYTTSHLKENFSQTIFRLITHFQKLKEGNASPVSFKISDDNQHLWTFASVEASKDACSGARYGQQYKRIK